MLEDLLSRGAVEAAPKLLGWVIVRRFTEGIVRLKIVEVEAYSQVDSASHSFRGQTKRTAPMFKSAGHIYVYFTYGMHYCLNFVAGPVGTGDGILIRAAEPIEGLEIIKRHRQGVKNDFQLTNGPAKLTQSLGIRDTGFSGLVFGPKTLLVNPPKQAIEPASIVSTTRIGIITSAELKWRFYIKDNPYVSIK